MRIILFAAATMVGLFCEATNVSAEQAVVPPSSVQVAQLRASLNNGTALGQRAVAVASKTALSLAAADSNFITLVNKKIASTAAERAVLVNSQKLRGLLTTSKAALSSKTSVLTVSEQRESSAALTAAYNVALRTDALSASAGNTISYKAADGSMQNVSFVLPPDAAAVVSAGTSSVSLTGLAVAWKKKVGEDTVSIKSAQDIFYVTALTSALAVDKLGCKGFSGYYSSDNAATPTFTKVGC